MKIKRDLIHKAKVRKEYAKVRTREQEAGMFDVHPSITAAANTSNDNNDGPTNDIKPPSPQANTMHQSRLDALNQPETSQAQKEDNNSTDGKERRGRQQRERKPKTSRYIRETEEGRKVREAREAHVRMVEEKKAAVIKREEDRRKRNNLMGFGKSARTKTGQAKLGRQSKGLLEKVMRIVGDE